MSHDNLIVNVGEDRVAQITLNRPDSLNTFTIGLARELDLCYTSINVVANRAPGRSEGEITIEEIQSTAEKGMVKVRSLIEYTIERIASQLSCNENG